ncbi:hypothetical protein XU06_29380 (plasmid) [Rhodococcus erythropolis]|nr:hypothetical protein XU06_29380 [Rhodococcus erythropolis]
MIVLASQNSHALPFRGTWVRLADTFIETAEIFRQTVSSPTSYHTADARPAVFTDSDSLADVRVSISGRVSATDEVAIPPKPRQQLVIVGLASKVVGHLK